MIEIDAFQIQSRETGLFYQLRHAWVEFGRPRYVATWCKDQAMGGVWKESQVDQAISNHGSHDWRKVRAPACGCCGDRRRRGARLKIVLDRGGAASRQWRCERHVGRNPCVVIGCGRTCAARHPSPSAYVCGTHWKLVPRSMRQVYSRIWRIHRKIGGWPPDLEARYWRIWRRIVAKVRSAGAGDVDMAEVNKLFGWAD